MGKPIFDLETQLLRVRSICLAMPEVTERPSHSAPSFFIQAKKCFVMFIDNHHGDGNRGLWCAAPPGEQEALVAAEPERFFRPPYVGGRGWLGVRLDDAMDDDELEEIVVEAWRMIAPKRLLQTFDAS